MDSKQIGFLELLNGQVQYVVPRWQRRYQWKKPEIDRLIDDLIAVADAGPEAGHFGGMMLTFREGGPAGIVTTYRLVDGQQRLTTVSLLLACIAEKLDRNGHSNNWTPQIIRDDRLTNPGKPLDKFLKLRLQGDDQQEYRNVLEGKPHGPGTVTQASKIIRRRVANEDTAKLLHGLERLRVVSIGLDEREDPQQIFESLNATGLPLTESEKVKNWLLIGLPEEQQRELHDTLWLEMERVLDAKHDAKAIDVFLRDLLRWRTGVLHGIDKIHEVLRRKMGGKRTTDRAGILHEFANLARLYGLITGTAGEHPDQNVERQLRHLRAMGIDVHRPLTLRLLSDAEERGQDEVSHTALAETVEVVGTWVTRMWLANASMTGLNKAMAELAHGGGPADGEEFAEFWRNRISRLRNQRIAVPNDDDVREGIRTRSAYGGNATQAANAVLCAMMEADHKEESPPRDRLTMEHVMPRKLTGEWQSHLGEDAEDVHTRWRDRLANLTLSGDATNSRLGAKGFSAKKQVYRSSPIGITRLLVEEDAWNEDTLQKRTEYLADRALQLWPWPEDGQARQDKRDQEGVYMWRIDGGEWHHEMSSRQTVLNVAAALIGRDPSNAGKLLGNSPRMDLQLTSPPSTGETTKRNADIVPVPGHEAFCLYVNHNSFTNLDRCRNMGQLCNISIEVELTNSPPRRFWKVLKERTGGVPGQDDSWYGGTLWTSYLNPEKDCVAIRLGEKRISLWISGGGSGRLKSERVWKLSNMIRDCMYDQDLSGSIDKSAKKGQSVAVERPWDIDDEDGWPDAADWLKDQCDRLAEIANSRLGDDSPDG